MTKTSLLFMLVCATCALDGAFGLGTYYWQTYLDNQDLIAYPHLGAASEVRQPECDSKEGSSESSSSSSEESSEESSSKSKKSKEKSSSSKSSEESGGAGNSKESGEKASLKKQSKEEASGEVSKENSKESSKEEKSGENSKESKSKESKSKESKSKESSEESKEKKKEGHKKKKGKEHTSLFPPRARAFSSRQMQPIVYSPLSTYSDSPYRASYVVKQPVASYPRKAYQYISLPSSASIVNAYSSPVLGKMFANTFPKVVYTPSTAKTVLVPGSGVYSSARIGYSFYKK